MNIGDKFNVVSVGGVFPEIARVVNCEAGMAVVISDLDGYRYTEPFNYGVAGFRPITLMENLDDSLRLNRLYRQGNEPKPVTFRIGQRFNVHGTEYILALVNQYVNVALINLEGGTRYKDPVLVTCAFAITREEANRIGIPLDAK